MKRMVVRWHMVIMIILIAGVMSYTGTRRLDIDMDVTRSLPADDPVISDAGYVMTHHPVKDRIVIDLGSSRPDIDALVEGASLVERRLSSSGLFRSVGLEEYRDVFPSLIAHIMKSLPVLFSAQDLESKVAPLLQPARVREALAENYAQLLDLEGIGQANMMAADPLGLKNLVLARMAHLAPSQSVRIVQGHLVSADGRHVLVMAEPKDSATDTTVARKIDSLVRDCAAELDTAFTQRGTKLTLTPVGAYRAALDNEETAKRDTRMAVVFATIGISILLLIGFPRPLLGLLALAPALLGTIAATFVYSLFAQTISVLAIGFGGALISFTVDYGIAYLLFLDRSHATTGMEATKEVWGLGLLAMLTTAVSFAFLFVSGFSALAQIGFFASMGVLFTFIFVHTLFPLVFPVMPPAKREGFVPLRKFVDLVMGSRSLGGVFAALAFCAVMLVFARPDFRVDLASMNTVSTDTLKAEELVTGTWGNVMSKLYLMTEGRSVGELQRKGDLLAAGLDREVASGSLSAAFVPSMIFPGEERRRQNLAAWRRFWTPARTGALRKTIGVSSREIGFSSGAFDPFFKTLERSSFGGGSVPEEFHGLLGIARMPGGGPWAQFSVLTPGPSYRAEKFHARVKREGLARLFDPGYFADRLGAVILDSFIKMALIVGGITLAVAFFYLLDLKLTLIALAPTVFSLVSTLGTLALLGRHPGIPAIMVGVIVIGMGTDYALYLVRAYQRYRDESHRSVGLIRLTIFLSACSTMIGFGVLSIADHALLRSAGLTLLLGVGYSFIGTVLIVPPLLARALSSAHAEEEARGPVSAGSREHIARVERRYRSLEPYPRLFARFKMKFEPMFADLHRFFEEPGTILDIGTGYGVPAAWLLELFPGARVYGIEPDEARRRVAARVIGGRGAVAPGCAPGLPEFSGKADAVLMLDMIHYLDDAALALLLRRVRERISRKGTLVVRATIPVKRRTLLRTIESLWIKMNGLSMNYRGAERVVRLMQEAGFSVKEQAQSEGGQREERWFVGTPHAVKAKKAPSQRGRRKPSG